MRKVYIVQTRHGWWKMVNENGISMTPPFPFFNTNQALKWFENYMNGKAQVVVK